MRLFCLLDPFIPTQIKFLATPLATMSHILYFEAWQPFTHALEKVLFTPTFAFPSHVSSCEHAQDGRTDGRARPLLRPIRTFRRRAISRIYTTISIWMQAQWQETGSIQCQVCTLLALYEHCAWDQSVAHG